MTRRLELRAVHSGYGRMEVLHGIDLTVETGESLLVLGRNGAGKSTLLRTIAGLQRVTSGSIALAGVRLHNRRPWQLVRRGVALMSEGTPVIGSRSLADNLRLALDCSPDPTRGHELVDRCRERFPALQNKQRSLAGDLSGGERSQLAAAQALAAAPRVLLLDEPSVGLSPQVCQQLLELVGEIAADEAAPLSVIIAEQQTGIALSICTRAVVLDNGHLVAALSADELRADPARLQEVMGLGSGLVKDGNGSPTDGSETAPAR